MTDKERPKFPKLVTDRPPEAEADAGRGDNYGTGIRLDQVQLQKIDPPTQVIDAFRDVQAAATDKEKLQNEALTYASRIVPTRAAKLSAPAGRQRLSAANGCGSGRATARFLKIPEYKKAAEVTRKRMYLETMEGVFGNADKIIIDSKSGPGVVPFLSLDQLQKRKEGG